MEGQKNRHTDGNTNMQTDVPVDGQTDKQTRQTDNTDRQTDIQLTLNRSTNVTLGEITRLPEKSERASPGKITS